MPDVALATCAQFATLDDDDRLVVPALAALRIDARPVVWDDPAVDWATFDVVVVRETWDYVERRQEFLAWTRAVDAAARLLNPPDVIAWNTDKTYLRALAAGVPVVPTRFLSPGADPDDWRLAADLEPAGDVVVKPTVSAGSRDTMRYAAADPDGTARAHVARLLADGRDVMVQPYLDGVDDRGETALLFFRGAFSHAIRKGPLLVRDVEGARVSGLFVQEDIEARVPTAAELDVAHHAVAAIPGGAAPLYARVDVVPGPDGTPLLLELELTEPSLFLAHADGAAARLAAAIAASIRA